MKHLKIHPTEEVLFTYRQTELVLVKPLALISLAIIAPWLFLFKYDLTGEFGRVVGFFTVLAILWALRIWVIWHLRRYIVTSQRLIHISHYGLFKKQVAETPLQRILNVSYKTTGLLSSIFHFGDVEVQVVGLLEPILLKNITRPSEIKDFLWELHSKYQTAETSVSAEDIPKLEEKIGYEKSHKT